MCRLPGVVQRLKITLYFQRRNRAHELDAGITKSVMSSCDSSSPSQLNNCKNLHLSEGCKGSEDESRRLKRREKNRVSARKSRKRQTQRADILHQACELLEQRNMKLRQEVDSLSEEQRLLDNALQAHEPLCPIMHRSFTSSFGLPDTVEAQSV